VLLRKREWIPPVTPRAAFLGILEPMAGLLARNLRIPLAKGVRKRDSWTKAKEGIN